MVQNLVVMKYELTDIQVKGSSEKQIWCYPLWGLGENAGRIW